MMFRTRLAISVVCVAVGPMAGAQEFRGLWADTFHAGLRNAAEVTAMVDAARAGNCNALVVEVRKRGDAYYRNGLEPVATDVAAGFDPLADLVAKAHDTSGGKQRIEVHAWLVTFNIWNRQTTPPTQPTHPYNLHPDWISQKYRPNTTDPVVTWDGSNYVFDQGHPAVQQHTFDVAMDILRRYAVDGIHFDYIRYSDDSSGGNQPWGYHPVAVERFKRLKSRATTPLPTDPTWLQWRRDQVTALLRKVYLHAWAERPQARISAALIVYDPAPTLTASSWLSSAAYSRVLQDWRAWLEEGILDLGCPMAYKTNNTSFANWTSFIRERQYSRANAIGMGWYLNPIENTIDQVGMARSAGQSGKKAAGVLGYSYAVPNSSSVPRATFLQALTDDATAELYDPGGTPVFPSRVNPPPMPWKTDLAKGHVMGFVTDGASAAGFDGATVQLAGPLTRSLLTDATGFFGAVDLPVGMYTLSVTIPGFGSQARSIEITGAKVSSARFLMGPPKLEIVSSSWDPAEARLTMTWTSEPDRTYRIEFSDGLLSWSPLATGIPSAGTTTTYQTPATPANVTRRFWRVTEEP